VHTFEHAEQSIGAVAQQWVTNIGVRCPHVLANNAFKLSESLALDWGCLLAHGELRGGSSCGKAYHVNLHVCLISAMYAKPASGQRASASKSSSLGAAGVPQ
jgi:hypothetical protein